MAARPLSGYLLTDHARWRMDRRGIDETMVARVLAEPEQRHSLRPGRDVFQARVRFGGRPYLIRVIVDIDRDPPEVVTVYRTSRVRGYQGGAP